MDGQDDNAAPAGARQVDNAIRAIQQKKPIPTIDFSVHVMDDGTQVSTKERVCQGQDAPLSLRHAPTSLQASMSPNHPERTQ